jgi:hypothetical protein
MISPGYPRFPISARSFEFGVDNPTFSRWLGHSDGGTLAPRQTELVKLKSFVGMTVKATAGVLSISAETAKDYSAHARAWLFRER